MDPELRRRTLHQVVGAWADLDAAGARRSIVGNSGLDDTERHELLALLIGAAP